MRCVDAVREGCLPVSFSQRLAGDPSFKSRNESNMEAVRCMSSDMIEQDLHHRR